MTNRVPFESIFELSSEALVVVGDDGRVLIMNRAARELEGVDVAELLEGGATDPELVRFRAELEAGARPTAEVRVAGREGRPRRIAMEVRGERPHRVVAIRDVTERAELEEELAQLRRAESIGYMTASLAHDFNNLLTVITCSSAVLAMEIRDREQLLDLAHEIQLASERATAMVRQLLSRLRRPPTPPRRLAPSGAVAELRPLLERLVGEKVELRVSCEEDAGEAVIDRDAFEHALLNLAANARDAMPRGGRLVVAVRGVTVGEDEANPPAAAGRYVAVTVTDNGVGMSREVRDRVFERFFTTKDTSRGTGLGLAMVRRFAAQSGGCVSLHSAPGQGTSVTLYLPRV